MNLNCSVHGVKPPGKTESNAYCQPCIEKEKRIKELESQIEEMKNCQNCGRAKFDASGGLICKRFTKCYFYGGSYIDQLKHWQLKKKGG
jgi:hypothetical protein